jgi:N-acetyl-anhydromuramyl-L-alanine amidase AmpD
MKRIIVHWTAGTNKAGTTDLLHYHYLVQGDGTVVPGIYPVSANERLRGSAYAQHTRGTNEGSIGVSMCGMYGATEQPFKAGKYPITKKQWDRMILLVADLARKYKIPVTPKTILTHAEVQGTLGITQKNKWDITRLPWDSSRKGAKVIGDYLRDGVKLAMVPAAFRGSGKAPKPISVPVHPKPVLALSAAPAPSLRAKVKALWFKFIGAS